jgi:hypothetical protein
MIFFVIIFVIAIAFYIYYLSHGNYSEPASSEQPPTTNHPRFNILDDNGDPIGSPKLKIVIGGGDSDAPVQELQYFCVKDKGYHVSVWPKDQGFQGIDYIEFNIAGITHGEHIDDHLG